MTINKYFVFVPSVAETDVDQESQVQSEVEAQRQALVKQAQQMGEV